MNEITQTEPAVVEKRLFFSRVAGMFYQPTNVFNYLDEKPGIILALLIPAISTIMISIAVIIQNFRNPEMLAAMKKMPETMSNVMKYGGPIIGGIFGVIFAIGFLLIEAGVIHVIAPFLNGKGTYKKLVSVLGYSSAPMLIFGVISLIYVVLNPNEYIPFTASLGLFFTKEKVGVVWYVLCTRIDLFAFWSMFLSICGVGIIYKISWKKAAAIILALWLIGVGLQLGVAKVFEPLMKKSVPEQVDEE